MVFATGAPQPLSLPEELLEKEPLSIILEQSGEELDPMSRLDFGRVYTVEYNIKVKKIGRVYPGHVDRLDKYFLESVTGGSPFSDKEVCAANKQYNTVQRPVRLLLAQPLGFKKIVALCDSQTEENWIAQRVVDQFSLEASAHPISILLHYAGQTLTSKTSVTVTWCDDNPEDGDFASSDALHDTAFFVVEDAPFDILFGRSAYYTRRSNNQLPEQTRSEMPQTPQIHYDAQLSYVRNTTARDSEKLDPSYRVRTKDYKKFFQVGRVFSTLWSEPVGSSYLRNTAVSEVIYSERVHSRIRRFVVVRANEGSCTCLPVTSYSGAGPAKSGISLKDCGFIYSHGSPQKAPAMRKTPLKVVLSKGAPKIPPDSLVNYNKVFTVETNVKVRDVGELDPNSRILLLEYFRMTFGLPYDEADSDRKRMPSVSALAGVGGAALEYPAYGSQNFTGVTHPNYSFSTSYTTTSAKPQPYWSAYEDRSPPTSSNKSAAATQIPTGSFNQPPSTAQTRSPGEPQQNMWYSAYEGHSPVTEASTWPAIYTRQDGKSTSRVDSYYPFTSATESPHYFQPSTVRGSSPSTSYATEANTEPQFHVYAADPAFGNQREEKIHLPPSGIKSRRESYTAGGRDERRLRGKDRSRV